MSDQNKSKAALLVNAIRDAQFFRQFGEYFQSRDTRADSAWDSYGYTHEVSFTDCYTMYSRFGIANAVVKMIVDKCWQTAPKVCNDPEGHEETQWEREFSVLASRLELFERLRGLDWRQRVFRYAGLIMFVDDGKELNQPLVGRFKARNLVDVRPVIEGQLEPNQYDDNPKSSRYGMPVTYQFNEQGLGDKNRQSGRSVEIHYTRVIIWAEGADDGTIYGTPTLEPIFNSLVTLERLIGAGGTGYWKAARQAMNLNVQKDANLQQLAAALGTDLAGLPDAIDEQVDSFNRGFDKALMLQGIEAKTFDFSVPDPQQFFNAALSDVAAGAQIPLTILIGQQTGRLASDEDQSQWAQTAESRRQNWLNPSIKKTVQRFVELGFVSDPGADLCVEWEPLQEPSPKDKLERGKMMAETVKALVGTGVESPFTAKDIREESGFEPMDMQLEGDDEPEGGEGVDDPL